MSELEILLNDIKKKPNSINVKKYCKALEDSGLVEKQKISAKVKEDVNNYDQSTLNPLIPKEFKNKTQSKNSRIGVIKRKLNSGISSLAKDMAEPVRNLNEL